MTRWQLHGNRVYLAMTQNATALMILTLIERRTARRRAIAVANGDRKNS